MVSCGMIFELHVCLGVVFFQCLMSYMYIMHNCWFQLEAGQYCTFAIHHDGSASACGKGSYGRLGLGNSNNQPVPKKLQFDSR